MYQAIFCTPEGLHVDIPRYLRRHDIVYKRPALKPYDGLPIGDGSTGGLVYHNEYGFELSVNHTDALDFCPDGPMSAWSWESEEKNTAPVSCAKLTLKSSLPVFDWLYLREYEERLNMAEACIEGHAVTPFSKMNWKIYAPDQSGVIIFEIDLMQEEEAAFVVRMEKWSSPNFFHHYEQIVKIHDKNLKHVDAQIQDDTLIISQNLRKCHVTAAARAADASVNLLHSHGGELIFPKRRHHHFKLYVSTHAQNEPNAVSAALAKITHAQNDSQIWNRHVCAWAEFWNKSFIHLKGEDYLENLYYFHLYQMNSSSRGRYPLTFAGLWSWFKDSRNWGHFYHWNHQQNYWGLAESGHTDLQKNYFSYRFQMLPNAIRDAKRLFDVEGAFFSDISNYNGYNAIEPDTIGNLSVGAQISLDFYRHYRYTLDEAFLHDQAIPVITACGKFYLHMLQKGEDGIYHLKNGSTAYESYWNLKDTLTDSAMIRALFSMILELCENGHVDLDPAPYLDVMEHLYSVSTELYAHNDRKLEIFCVGNKWDSSPALYGDGKYPFSPFPASLMAPVCPASVIHLEDENSPLFQIAKNTARVLLDCEIYQPGRLGCCGHSPAPQMTARLGMRNDMLKVLRKYAVTYQIFPNGLMHFSDISRGQQWSGIDHPRILEPGVTSTCWEDVHDKSKGVRTKIDAEWFLHCYFEAASNILTGMEEMLMQSKNSLIHLFPALPTSKTSVFRLHAEGGFVITSECHNGDIRYAFVESSCGGTCRIQNPWPGETLRITHCGHTADYVCAHNIITLCTDAGSSYYISRAEYPAENYYQNAFESMTNHEPKQLEHVTLGLYEYY